MERKYEPEWNHKPTDSVRCKSDFFDVLGWTGNYSFQSIYGVRA
jgi:hypothetical protein